MQTRPSGAARTAALAPDGARIAVGIASAVEIWERGGTRPLRTLTLTGPNGDALAPLALAWSPDSAELAASFQAQHAAGGAYAALGVWEARSGTQRFASQTNGPVREIAWSPDGTTLAGYIPAPPPTGLGVILRWNGQSGELAQPIFTTVAPPSDLDHIFAWAPQGNALAVIDHGEVDIVSTAHAQVVERLTETPDLQSVAWSPDGAYLAVGHAQGAVTLWDAMHFTPVALVTTPLAAIHALYWSPTGAELLGVGNRQFALISVATRQVTRVIATAPTSSAPGEQTTPRPGKPDSSLAPSLIAGANVQTVIWSATGQSVGALFGDGAVEVWQLAP